MCFSKHNVTGTFFLGIWVHKPMKTNYVNHKNASFVLYAAQNE